MITIKECNTISVGDVPELDSAYIDENCRYICAFENKCVGILVYEVKEEILYIRYLFGEKEKYRRYMSVSDITLKNIRKINYLQL